MGLQSHKSNKVFKVDPNAPVLVFDETKYGIKSRRPSDILAHKKAVEHKTILPLTSFPKVPQDADDIADLKVNQIWERLKDTLEDVHASNLRGKERQLYLYEKAVRLGAQPRPPQQHPMNIAIGIRGKKQEREARRLARAREMDIIVSKSNNSRSGLATAKSKRRKLSTTK